MWKYEKPKMEVFEHNLEDVIITSGVTESGTIEDIEGTPETPFMPHG